MSEVAAEQDAKQPMWLSMSVRWLGYVTAGIVAVTAFLVAVGKFADAMEPACRAIGSPDWCHTVQIKEPPKLAAYDSPEVDGGHTQAEFCVPRLQAYQSQYPDFSITWKASETSRKSTFGHVTYRYHCEYAATQK